MDYRINKQELLKVISGWNDFLGRKVHLIACGGTALTLLEIKESTKDIDFIIPDEQEYDYLIKILGQLGYEPASGEGWSRGDGFIFDLFKGQRVFTTALLESPLAEGNNITLQEFSRIYLGILNYNDIIISKIFRGTSIDQDDCISLLRAKGDEIDINELKERYYKTALYEINDRKAKKNLQYFLDRLKKEGFING